LKKSILTNQPYSISLSGRFFSAPKVIYQRAFEIPMEQLRNFARVDVKSLLIGEVAKVINHISKSVPMESN
jgi:hypothetical protein